MSGSLLPLPHSGPQLPRPGPVEKEEFKIQSLCSIELRHKGAICIFRKNGQGSMERPSKWGGGTDGECRGCDWYQLRGGMLFLLRQVGGEQAAMVGHGLQGCGGQAGVTRRSPVVPSMNWVSSLLLRVERLEEKEMFVV